MDDYDYHGLKYFNKTMDSLFEHLHFSQDSGYKVAAIFLQGVIS